MKHLQLRSSLGLAGLAAALTACSGGGGSDTGNGSLGLAVMDAPVDDVAHLYVQFTGVSLKPQGNGPAIDINFSTPVTLDLLALNADNTEVLLDSHPVPAGAYNWLDLHVNATLDGVL